MNMQYCEGMQLKQDFDVNCWAGDYNIVYVLKLVGNKLVTKAQGLILVPKGTNVHSDRH